MFELRIKRQKWVSLLFVVTFLFGLLGFGGSGLQASYAQEKDTIFKADKTEVIAGETVALSVYAPNQTNANYEITLCTAEGGYSTNGGEKVGTTGTTDEQGKAQSKIDIPAAVTAGNYQLELQFPDESNYYTGIKVNAAEAQPLQEINALIQTDASFTANKLFNMTNVAPSQGENPAPVVDKSQLDAKIIEAQALDESQYTEITWATLTEKLTAATIVSVDETATQEAVDQALADLTAAFNALQKKEVSAKLKDLIIQSGEQRIAYQFDPNTTSHLVGVENGINSITITPIAESEQATIKMWYQFDARGLPVGDPLVLTSGQPSAAQALDLGTNRYRLEITLEEGNNKKEIYNLTINQRYPYAPNKVVEFLPAPGQFTNQKGWGLEPEKVIYGPWEVGLPASVGVSLGTFGGYIVLEFDQPVKNDPKNPYGIDFIVYGNAFSGWGEPGGVMVKKDANNPWYHIAGSEHYEDETITNYQVTYTNPDLSFSGGAQDIPWTDNQGQTGAVKANSYHKQSYYPNPANYNTPTLTVSPTSLTLQGVKLKQRSPAFGYTDITAKDVAPYNISSNPYQPYGQDNKAQGDPIDISWAVDENGVPVYLDEIKYVKIYTGVLEDAGGLGEVSTEVTGLARVAQDNSVQATADLTDISIIGGGQTKKPEMKSGQYVYEDLTIDAPFVSIAVNDDVENIYINNQRLAKGESSKRIFLSADQERLVRIIAQSDKNTPKIYLFKIKSVTKGDHESDNAYLENLVLSAGDASVALDPNFDLGKIEYTTDVVNKVENIIVTPTTLHPAATFKLKINGQDVAEEQISEPLALKLGANKIEVEVTAGDGSTTKTYTVTVNRVGFALEEPVTPKELAEIARNKTIDYYKNNGYKLDWWQEMLGTRFAGEDITTSPWILTQWTSDNLKTTNNAFFYARYMLGLLAQGKDPATVWAADNRNLVAELKGKQNLTPGDYYGGFDSSNLANHLWGMIAADAAGADYNREAALEFLIKKQKADGGFTDAGNNANPAHTGLALLAMAKHRDVAGVNDAIAKADNYLKQQQLNTGGFKHKFGNNENTEAIAWIISGLVAAGEDVLSANWTKEGNTALDALLRLMHQDGSFTETEDKSASNTMATRTALVALGDLTLGSPMLYQLSAKEPQYTITPAEDETYSIGKTDDGISTMTVNTGVSGINYFSIEVTPVYPHEGLETAVFTHLRKGDQLSINAIRADFDTVQITQAGFNVKPGDVVKAYLVDELTNAEGVNPVILQ